MLCWFSGKVSWYFIPFTVLTLVFGSIRPLLYLVLNSEGNGGLNADQI